MAMSDDGSILVTTYSTDSDAEVYANTNDGFEFKQTLAGSNGAFHVAISASNSIVLSVGSGTIKYYTLAASGSY